MASFSEKYRERWRQGTLHDAYRFLGAHPAGESTTFRVWAPHARRVCIMGDFNDWQQGRHKMHRLGSSGFWEAAVPGALPGQCYKYAVTAANGAVILKADPFAFYAEEASHHASVVYALPSFEWQDERWLHQQKNRQARDEPLAIYEVHPGSWRHDDNGAVMPYQQLAGELIPYVKKMGFTHIELLPVMEHPYTPSWGYQITGYFAATARYGRPEDLMVFVDACHRHEIGVILDWVPGHFPKDEHGLSLFDGTPLFEHADPRRSEHADWGTHNFDFEKPQVRSFLLASAHFWCQQYHIDGLRVDAVASMLYLDYSKEKGEWLPNVFGGRQNMGAVTFLQDFNQLIQEHFPGVLTIAEESTDWPGVTQNSEEGGLGFDYKWNMGWMNDTLRYFEYQPEKRLQENHAITFPVTYARDEHFILPFSHDEVVHLKKSLWSKMPGDRLQKFAQLKLLFLYMMGCPGKKLLFMGSELAEKQEWSEGRALHWPLLKKEEHKEVQAFLARLLHRYRLEPALYQSDHCESGFEWKDLSKKGQGIFAFSRQAEAGPPLLFIFNFNAQGFDDYHAGGIENDSWEMVMDTRGKTTSPSEPGNISFPLSLAPFQGIMLRPDEKE